MTLDCVASFIAQTPTITPTQPPDGLTQPQATIWAALIAVGAATIALIGVIINAVISQRQHRDKERAALKERNRKEAVNTLVEALGAANVLVEYVGSMHANFLGLDRTGSPPSALDVDQARASTVSSEMKLELLGLDPSESLRKLREASMELVDAVDAQEISPLDFDFAPVRAARDRMVREFRATLSRIDSNWEAHDH